MTEKIKWSQFLPQAVVALPDILPRAHDLLFAYIEAYEQEALGRLMDHPTTQCGEAVRCDAVLERAMANVSHASFACLSSAPLYSSEFAVRLTQKQSLPVWRCSLPLDAEQAICNALQTRHPFAIAHEVYMGYPPQQLAKWMGPIGIRSLQHARNRFLRLHDSLQASDGHVIEPLWEGGVTRCVACGKRRDPTKIASWDACSARSDMAIPHATLREWRHRVSSFLETVKAILKCLHAPEAMERNGDWRDLLSSQVERLSREGPGGILDLCKSPHHKRARGGHVALRHAYARWTAIKDAWAKEGSHKVVCDGILTRPLMCLNCDRKPPPVAGVARWLRNDCKPCREGGLGLDGDMGLIIRVHGLLAKANLEFNGC